MILSNISRVRDGINTNQGIFFRSSCASVSINSTTTSSFLYFAISFQIATNQSGGGKAVHFLHLTKVIFDSLQTQITNGNGSKISFTVKNTTVQHDTIITGTLVILEVIGRSKMAQCCGYSQTNRK